MTSLSITTIFVFCAAFAAAQDSPLTKEKVLDRMQPYSGPSTLGVDASSLKGKIMCGYQGWFAADGDGSGHGWSHFAHGRTAMADGKFTVELWPDMGEMDDDEKYPTPLKNKDGSTANLFSSANPKTVLRHFKWMKDNGIDGVFLQRFAVSVCSPHGLDFRNRVTANVQAGANQQGRTWAMMYDLSGLKAGDIEKYVTEDWMALVDRMKITQDKAYLHHNGKPVIAVWGIGFSGHDRKYSLEECEKLVKFLKSDPKYGGNTVMLGVPTSWRTLSGDAVSDPKLHDIIRQADIVSPWSVGRYHNEAGIAHHAESNLLPDIEWCRKEGKDYMPVAFPGFSWHNLMATRGSDAPLNQIPRQGGQFLWTQAVAQKKAGAGMIYVAMFDEIDEGTAIFKCTNNPPVSQAGFVTYEGCPSDHYLWLTGQIGRMLRNELEASGKMPSR